MAVCKVSFCFIGSAAAVNVKIPSPVRCVDKAFCFHFFPFFRGGERRFLAVGHKARVGCC